MYDEDELEHFKVKAQIVEYDEDTVDPYVIEARTTGSDGREDTTQKVSRRYSPEGALLIATATVLGFDVDDVLDTDELESDE